MTEVIGIPDRIFFVPKDGPAIIEFKARDESPGEIQSWYLKRLRQLGYSTYWCETREEFLAVMKRHGVT